MTRINTNVSSLVAQNRLQSSNKDLNTALTRLSTGLRINSGSDDPAGLIASEALRGEITGLTKSISNTQRASQIISTADSALGQVSSLLNDVRGLVVEASNTGGLSTEEIAANQLQIDSSLEAINRISQTTTFQGRKLLDGSLDFTSTASSVASLSDFSIDQASLGSTGSVDVDVNITSAATQATSTIAAPAFETVAAVEASATLSAQIDVTASTAGEAGNDFSIEFVDDTGAGDVAPAAVLADGVITVTYNSTAATSTNLDIAAFTSAIDGITGVDAAAATGVTTTDAFTVPASATELTGGAEETTGLKADLVFQLNGADGAETFNFGAGTTADQVASAINLVKDSTGVEAAVASDVLTLTSTDYGSNAKVGVEVISEGAGGLFEGNVSTTNAKGADIVASVNGVEANGNANSFSINTSTLDLSLTVDNGSDTNFSFSINGGGAKFQLGPDVVSNQQASLGIGAVSTGKLGGAAGRLYELGSGQAKSLANDSAGAAKIIDEVIAKVTGIRGRLGAFQSTTLDSNLTSLNESRANLQEAESSIRDADFASESANLTRAQILVQSGTNVLSLANQNPQNVLALLG